MSLFVHRTTNANHKRVVFRNVFGIYLDKTSAEVSGIFRRRGLNDSDVVDLRGGDDVERKSARISLRTRHCATVYPYVVVSLRQSANHDKFILDNTDSRHPSHYLRGVFILRFLNLLCRHARIDCQRRFHLIEQRRIDIAPRLCHHRYFVERLFRRL